MENENNNTAEIVKALLASPAAEEAIKAKADAENKERERLEAIKTKYSKPFKIAVGDKVLELSLKSKITPETRHRIRTIAKTVPNHKIRQAIEVTRLETTDLTEIKLYEKLLEKGFTVKEIIDFSHGIPDENYEQELEIFYMKYFQVILSETSESKQLIDTLVCETNMIYECWNLIDYDTVVECVNFFRTKTGL
jgi:hypothetical protein